MKQAVSQINIGRIKVIFGQNSISTLPNELNSLNIARPLLVADPVLIKLGTVAAVIEILREQNITTFLYDKVTSEPGSLMVDEAVALLKENKCDGVIALGGGSVMDLSKCVAAMGTNPGRFLDYDYTNPNVKTFANDCLPLISIPTTAGTGSELSQYAAIRNDESGVKAGVGSPKLMAYTALVDPVLLRALPRNATAACGCDALAHCIEAFVSTKSLNAPNMIIDGLALQAIALLYRYLPRAVENGDDMDAREMVSWSATIGGIVLQYGSGAAHGISNVIGGQYHVPHGNAIAMLLPHVLRYNLPQCEARYSLIAERLGMNSAEEAIEALAEMIESFRLPRLSAYVPDASALEEIAALAVREKCTKYNGRPVTVADARTLLEKAY